MKLPQSSTASATAKSPAKSQAEVYLDYNATHPLLPRVAAAMVELLKSENHFILGNASSVHAAGRRSRKWINTLKIELQNFLNAPIGEWVLYSGATEALNAVLSSALCENWDILSSSVEHSAVYETLGCGDGTRLMLPVTRSGKIDIEQVSKIVSSLGNSQKPILFSLQAHNNETGLCVGCPQVLKSLRKIGEECGREVKILLDGVQSLGKADPQIMTELLELADYAVFSGHKMGAMMGIGALWKRKNSFLKSYPTGGGQERGLRAGTEPIWNVVSWVEAIRDWQENGGQYRQHMEKLKQKLLEGLKEISGIKIIDGTDVPSTLPNTVAILAVDRGSDFILQKLDLDGVLVSGGSACRSGVSKPSHVMKALGYDDELSKGLIRISMGPMSTEDDIEKLLLTLGRI